MNASRLGISTAVVVMLVDQVTKLYLLYLYDLPLREPVRLAPFLDLIIVWNRGISYGLFQQHSDLGRWLLIGISLVAALALGAWIRRTQSTLLALSLGLIAGGAVGNALIVSAARLNSAGRSYRRKPRAGAVLARVCIPEG